MAVVTSEWILSHLFHTAPDTTAQVLIPELPNAPSVQVFKKLQEVKRTKYWDTKITQG